VIPDTSIKNRKVDPPAEEIFNAILVVLIDALYISIFKVQTPEFY